MANGGLTPSTVTAQRPSMPQISGYAQTSGPAIDTSLIGDYKNG